MNACCQWLPRHPPLLATAWKGCGVDKPLLLHEEARRGVESRLALSGCTLPFPASTANSSKPCMTRVALAFRGGAAAREALQRAVWGRSRAVSSTTVLIIAHQVLDLEKCNHVVVMSEGRAVQQGTPKELGECAEGVYASLLKAAGRM